MSRIIVDQLLPCQTNFRSLECFARFIEAQNQALVTEKLRSYYAIDIEGKERNLDEIASILILDKKELQNQADIINKKACNSKEIVVLPSTQDNILNNIFNFKVKNTRIQNPFRRLLAQRGSSNILQ